MIAEASAAGKVRETVASIRGATDLAPEAAVVLGTGLSGLASQVDVAAAISYADLPGFPRSTVETHAGRLLLGTLEGKRVAVMQGRTHAYEGYGLREITFPIRVLRELGAGTLIVSNVSGGMHPLWSPGDLVLITDHINLLGDNPLVGPEEGPGPRFPDMSEAYDRDLAGIARTEALRLGVQLREGV